VVSQSSQLLGRQAGLSVDTLVRNTLHAGATIDYAASRTSRVTVAAGDVITYNDLVNQMATLMSEDAMPSDGGSYAVIIHPLTLAVLLKDTNFKEVFVMEASVSQGSPIRMGRVGKLFNFDFYVSSNAVVYAGEGAAGIDVYAALFIGGESYGMAGFTGFYPQMGGFEGSGEYDNMTGKFASPIQIIVRALGETGFDPLKQRGTIGWLLYEDDVVLNDSWIYSFEHAIV
jgi:N4-gp56 family major capsid protein